MSAWPSTRARRVLAALLSIGWVVKRQSGSHYYSRRDGVETIWLVNSRGEYACTIDEPFLRRHFEVVEAARERSIYGRGRPRLGPLTSKL